MRPVTTIDGYDIGLLQAGRAALGVDEVAGEALHLGVAPDGRTWIIESEIGQFTAALSGALDDGDDDAPAVASPGDGCSEWFAVSERLVRFGESLLGESIRLSVADERTMVATVDGLSAAVDLVIQDGHRPEPWEVTATASATVPLRQFMAALWAARCLPSGVDQAGYPMPTMWMQVGDGSLGLHVDWSDFIPSQATYRCDADTTGQPTTVAIPHAELGAFLGDAAVTLVEPDVEVRVEIGVALHEGRLREALVLRGGPWRLLLWLQHPLRSRWSARIDVELADDDIEVLTTDGLDWTLVAGDPPLPDGCRPQVRITLHHGHPDIARVSAAITPHVAESLELLRELSALNAASTGVRFWLEDDTVFAATDVRCSALSTLPSAVHSVARAVTAYGSVLAALSG